MASTQRTQDQSVKQRTLKNIKKPNDANRSVEFMNSSVQNLQKISELRSIIVKNKLSSYVKTEVDQNIKNAYPKEKQISCSLTNSHRNSVQISLNDKHRLKQNQSHNSSPFNFSKNYKKQISSFHKLNLKKYHNKFRDINQNLADFNASFVVIKNGAHLPLDCNSLQNSLVCSQKSQNTLLKAEKQSRQCLTQPCGIRTRKILVSSKKMIKQNFLDQASDNCDTLLSLPRYQLNPRDFQKENKFSIKKEKNQNDSQQNIFKRTDTQNYRLKTASPYQHRKVANQTFQTCDNSLFSTVIKANYQTQIDNIANTLINSTTLNPNIIQSKYTNEQITSEYDDDYANDSNTYIDVYNEILQNSNKQPSQLKQTSSSLRQTPFLKRRFSLLKARQKQDQHDINSVNESVNQNRYLPNMYKYQSFKQKASQSLRESAKDVNSPIANQMKVLAILNYQKIITEQSLKERCNEQNELSNFYQKAKKILVPKISSNLLDNCSNNFILKVTPPSPKQKKDFSNNSTDNSYLNANKLTLTTQNSDRSTSKSFSQDFKNQTIQQQLSLSKAKWSNNEIYNK